MRSPRLAAILALAGLASVSAPLVPSFAPVALWGGWVAICFAPGLAVSHFLASVESWPRRTARALFLSPLLSGVLATAFMALGFHARDAGLLVATVGTISAVAALLGPASVPRAASRWDRRLGLLMVGLAVLVLFPHAVREWARWRSDAWFHSAVVAEIAARGVPPGDPYFAGLDLNYLWFYHALLAAWSALCGVEPWNLGGAINAGWLASLAGGVYGLSRRLGRRQRESFFAAAFAAFGLQAAFWLWIPLKVARGLFGETGGPEHLGHLLGLAPFTYDAVCRAALSFGGPPPAINKFWTMSAFGGGVLAVPWLLDGVLAGARQARFSRDRTIGRAGLLAVAASSFGAWILHPSAGLLAAVALTLAGAWLLVAPRGVPRRAVAAVGAAFGLGSAAAAPWILASAGRAETAFPLGFEPAVLVAAVTASFAAILFALPVLRFRRAGSIGGAGGVLLGATAAASLIVILPPPNTIDKMPFFFFLPFAVPAGWTLAAWVRRWTRRRAWAACLLVFAPVHVVFLAGILFGRGDPAPSAAERDLYREIAARTPRDAVVLDTAERDDVLVRVPRRQYWGREPYAEQWGYPADEMARRRLVRDTLNRAGSDEPRWDRVERALAELDAFAGDGIGPLYVVWRPADHGGRTAEASVMGRRPDRFQPLWSNEAGALFRYREKSGS